MPTPPSLATPPAPVALPIPADLPALPDLPPLPTPPSSVALPALPAPATPGGLPPLPAPVARFPLEVHQARTSYVVSHGLLRRVLPHRALGGPRCVNSVLLLPDGRRPGAPPVSDDGFRAFRESPR
ncbi:hypothetical protein GCM10027162_02940 [Streptomyces incanus]